jgi:hypothetical protein
VIFLILDRIVNIQSKTETIDSEGIVIETWSNLLTTLANKHYFGNGKYDLNEYGYNKASEAFMYITPVNDEIAEGQRLIDGLEKFLIVSLKKYTTHYELIVETIIE